MRRSTILLQRLQLAMYLDAIAMHGITLECCGSTMLLSEGNFVDCAVIYDSLFDWKLNIATFVGMHRL